jgi:Flp pilus assembly pilin Flp
MGLAVILPRVFGCVPRLPRDSRAVTSLEYGILAGVLGLVLLSMFHNLGLKLTSLFVTIGNAI